MWLITIILGALLGSILTAIFDEQLKFIIASRFFSIDQAKENRIKGEWDIPLEFCGELNNSINTAIIKIRRFPGITIGELSPDYRSSIQLRKQFKRPSLVYGQIIGDYFTGTWFDPDDRNRFHGAFQMKLNASGKCISGKRLGLNAHDEIVCEDWKWYPHEEKMTTPQKTGVLNSST